jgi:hypothetical protein
MGYKCYADRSHFFTYQKDLNYIAGVGMGLSYFFSFLDVRLRIGRDAMSGCHMQKMNKWIFLLFAVVACHAL